MNRPNPICPNVCTVQYPPPALFDTLQRSKSQQRLKDRPSKANTLPLTHAKPEVWSQLSANDFYTNFMSVLSTLTRFYFTCTFVSLSLNFTTKKRTSQSLVMLC